MSLGALAMAAGAGAADLNFSVSSGMEYDSQATQEQGDQGDDFGFRLSPTLVLRETEPRFHYQVLYQPTYVQFINTTRDEDVDHLGSLGLVYSLGPRTQLSVDNRLTYFRRYIFETFQQTGPSGDIISVSDDDLSSDRQLRNDADIRLEHRFTERLSGSSSFAWSLLDAEADDLTDSNSLYTQSELSYALDKDSAVGGGAAYTFQYFQQVQNPPPNTFGGASESYIYEAFGSASRRFAGIYTFTLRGGPSLIASRVLHPLPLQINGEPIDADAQRWTFFGLGRISARWSETLRSYASYRRSQDDSSGQGRTTIRDSVSVYTSWQPAELWTLDVLGEWVQRKRAQAEEVNGLDETQWRLTAGASRRVTRRSSVGMHLYYNRSRENAQPGVAQDNFNQVLVFLEFRYDFDPFKVWN